MEQAGVENKKKHAGYTTKQGGSGETDSSDLTNTSGQTQGWLLYLRESAPGTATDQQFWFSLLEPLQGWGFCTLPFHIRARF